MTNQRKLEIGLAVVVTLAAAVFLHGWLQAREANNNAEVHSQVLEQTVAEKNHDLEARDAHLAAYLDKVDQQVAALKTPQQAVKVIELHVPTPAGQEPIIIQRSDLSAKVQAETPDSPGYALMTSDEVQAIAKDQLKCEADRNALLTCKADATDLREIISAKDREVQLWKTAASGGSKWQRFGRVLKSVGCGAGGAALGSVVTRGNQPTGAAVGAAGGVVACSLF